MNTPTLSLQSSLADAARRFDEERNPVLVLADDGSLVGVVGDGALREAAFKGLPGTAPIGDVVHTAPLVVTGGAEDAKWALSEGTDEVVVCLDERGQPVACHARASLLPEERPVQSAILMVGGEGTRLRPLTENVPKPMLPVGGVPILERIVRSLDDAGVQRFTMALGYRAEQIVSHFGEGREDSSITYVHEEKPLGTAGAIGLVEDVGEGPLLVMNGDILTDLDFRAMALAHHRSGAAVTVAVRPYHHQVPYGVMGLVDGRVVSIDEKPTQVWWTNAGIYLMNKSVQEGIKRNAYLDMTVLMERLIGAGDEVRGFPIREYWCDIGQREDYERANARLSS